MSQQMLGIKTTVVRAATDESAKCQGRKCDDILIQRYTHTCEMR